MTNERIIGKITEFATINADNLERADNVAFFDNEHSEVFVIDANDIKNGKLDSCMKLERTSDLNSLGRIYFANLTEFIDKYEVSGIEGYLCNGHIKKMDSNYGKYITAYVHLYKHYKSLAVFAEKGFDSFIDAFIEDCCCSKTDHPNTIGYNGSDLRTALRLHSYEYSMFDKEIRNYGFYVALQNMQYHCKFTEKQLRRIRKVIKGLDFSARIQFLQTVGKASDKELERIRRSSIARLDGMLSNIKEAVTETSKLHIADGVHAANVSGKPMAA